MRASTTLPSLAVLRCFESAAKHQSFTAASEELGLTQGAVSRHIKDLETQIGAALFRREGRGVRLTDAGKTLASSLNDDLDRLRQTIGNAIAAGNEKEILSLAVLPTFGTRWLMPRLANFKVSRSDVEFVVVSRSEPFDLAGSGIDLAIHFGIDDWPGAQLTPLCSERLLSVAAPTLIEQYRLARPEDMFRAPLLHLSSRPALWDTFRRTLNLPGTSGRQGSYFDQFSLIIAAATSGLGAAIIPAYLIEEELRDGRLVELGEVPDSSKRGYFVATPAGPTRPLTKDFIRWIRKQVSASLKW